MIEILRKFLLFYCYGCWMLNYLWTCSLSLNIVVWSQWIAETGRACEEYGYTVNSRSPHNSICQCQQLLLRYCLKRHRVFFSSLFSEWLDLYVCSHHIASYDDSFFSYQNTNKVTPIQVFPSFWFFEQPQGNCWWTLLIPVCAFFRIPVSCRGHVQLIINWNLISIFP